MTYQSAPFDDQLPIVRPLPQGSQAADRLLDTIDYNQKVGAYNQQQKIKQAQDMAQSYRDNAFKAKNGTLFNNELQAAAQKHIQQGIEYAKQGFDIYSPNPNNESQMAAHEQYMGDRQKIYNDQDIRGELATHLLEQDKKYSEAKQGTYDTDSLNALHDFYTKNTLRDIVDKGLKAPFLQGAYDPELHVGSKIKPVMSPETEFVKNGHKITDKQFMPRETYGLAETLFKNSPGGENFLKKQTGLTPGEAKTIPDGLPAITKLNDDTFRSTDAGRTFLAQNGITSYTDPRYQELLLHKSQQDFLNKQKYKNYIGGYVDRARASANLLHKDTPDFTYADEHRKNLDEARKEKNQAHTEAEWANKDQSDQPLYNVEGTAVAPRAVGQEGQKAPVTYPLVLPNIGKTMTVTPNEVHNPLTGHFAANAAPIMARLGSPVLKPIVEVRDANGNLHKQSVSDAEVEAIKSGTFKIGNTAVSDKDLKYRYMINGVQNKQTAVTKPGQDSNGKDIQVPTGKFQTVQEPISFDASAVNSKLYNKNLDYDAIESKLPDFIKSRIVRPTSGSTTDHSVITKTKISASSSKTVKLSKGSLNDLR